LLGQRSSLHDGKSLLTFTKYVLRAHITPNDTLQDETVFWISNDDLPTHNDIATLQQGSTSLSLIVRQFQDV
jgi:hypothetical protein